MAVAASVVRGDPAVGRKLPRAPSKSDMVRDWLLGQIVDGTFGRDQQLPSESELMARFGVSRVTVRRALDRLRSAGMVEGRQGRGYFVRRLRAVQDLGRLQGFGEMLAGLGVETRSKVLHVAEIPAAAAVAQALRLPAGAPVTRIERVRIANGMPLSHDVSHFPVEIGRRLVGLDLPREDIFRLLETELQIELGFADLQFEVVRDVDATVARSLGRQGDEPIIRIERITSDVRCRPIDFEYLYALADTFQFHIRVPRW